MPLESPARLDFLGPETHPKTGYVVGVSVVSTLPRNKFLPKRTIWHLGLPGHDISKAKCPSFQFVYMLQHVCAFLCSAVCLHGGLCSLYKSFWSGARCPMFNVPLHWSNFTTLHSAEIPSEEKYFEMNEFDGSIHFCHWTQIHTSLFNWLDQYSREVDQYSREAIFI